MADAPEPLQYETPDRCKAASTSREPRRWSFELKVVVGILVYFGVLLLIWLGLLLFMGRWFVEGGGGRSAGGEF